jgi:hypothetical protein
MWSIKTEQSTFGSIASTAQLAIYLQIEIPLVLVSCHAAPILTGMGTGRLTLVLSLAITLAGCTQAVDPPQALPGIPVAPITALQASDLLSPDIQDKSGNLFATVEPARCSGVAQEVDPPFIFDHAPAAHDGGHWVVAGNPEVYIEEMVGIFGANFDAEAALGAARRTVEACQGFSFAVTSMQDRTYDFTLLPTPQSDSPNIVLWSFRAADWACDSAFVAAHNAAVEISTCAEVGGYDVLTLAQEALNRIETLANTVA